MVTTVPAAAPRATANNFAEFEALIQAAVARGGVTTIGIGQSFDFPHTIVLNSTQASVNILFQCEAGTSLGVEGFFRHFEINATGNFILELKDAVLDGRNLGGGISFSGYRLALFSGSIINCLAYNGGGLYVESYAVVEAMHFGHNTVQTQPGDNNSNTGGAIYLQSGGELYLLAETVLEYNGGGTVRTGGGVYAGDNATVDIRQAVLQYNEAQSGGGITLGDQSTLQMGGYIQGNRAFFSGGGIYGAYTTESSSGQITQTSYLNIRGHVKDNESERTAGGIYGGVVTLGRGAFVSRNTVIGPGSEAGILCARFVMNDGIVSYNTLITPTDGYTPGVGVKCTSALINGGSINHNTYTNDTGKRTGGGGIFCSPRLEGDTIIINAGSITANKAHTGGGVFMFASSAVNYTSQPVISINGGEISANEAVSGGGIYSYGFDLEIANAQISDNLYTTYGGGIYTVADRLMIRDTEIRGNKPAVLGDALYGGGVYLNFYQPNRQCVVDISGTTRIEHNESSNGGGLYLGVSRDYDPGSLRIADSVRIVENGADGSGGGLFLSNMVAQLLGPLQIRGNSARSGGGLAVNRSRLTLSGESGTLLLSGNKANNGGGIYAYNDGSDLQLLSAVSLTDNNAAGNGGAIWVDHLTKVSVQAPSVIFQDNLAERGYQMTDADDIALHQSLIQTETFSQPFRYAYNNYDIVYEKGNPVTDNATVSFESNGGSYIPPQSVEIGGLVEEPETPLRPGYTFAGWFRDAALMLPWDFGSDTVTEDITLYAKWLDDGLVTGYTVTYQANGGIGGRLDSGLLAGSGYVVLTPAEAEISRSGYLFRGWNTAANGTGVAYQPGDLITISGDLTLYAQWQAAVVPPPPCPCPCFCRPRKRCCYCMYYSPCRDQCRYPRRQR